MILAIKYYCKGLHLRYLWRSWLRLWSVFSILGEITGFKYYVALQKARTSFIVFLKI